MDPMTLMALGSTALTAIGKLGSGFMSSNLDKLQQSIANGNAQLLLSKAQLEAQEGQIPLAEGRLEQSRTMDTINRTLGAETGKFAASNLDPTYGSPLLLEGFSAGQGATDMALIGAKAELGYAGALTQSAGTMAERTGQVGMGAAYGMKATQDVVSGIIGAGTSLLGGLSNKNQWAGLQSIAGSIGDGASSGINMLSTMFAAGG
jgi:hypothetical protein